MEFSAIRAFIEVAEQGSFSLAAENLFLTQPAISKRIAALEAELGTPLFDRMGRKIALTEAGRILLPRARNLLNEIADMKRQVIGMSGKIQGPLILGTSHHIGLHRLPPVLQTYTGNYPEVKLDIRFLDSEAACRSVEQGELELAIVTLPHRANSNLSLEPVWDDPLKFMVNPQHPLAEKKQLRLSELAAMPAVLPGASTFTRAIIEDAFDQAGLKLTSSMSTNYLETLKMLAATGQGWTLLPASMLDESLITLKLPIQPRRQLGIVLHTGRTPSNAARALIRVLREHKTVSHKQ